MNATFKELTKPTKFNLSHRKGRYFSEEWIAVVFNGERAYEAVNLRIYATDSRAYCCLWVNDNCSWKSIRTEREWRNGSGFVGGYGYHRASAAAQEAIYNAGIELSEDINGRGDYAIQEAVYAIAATMWATEGYYIHVVHSHA